MTLPAPTGPDGAAAVGARRASAVERYALAEMTRLMRKASGDHPTLADVRAEIAARTDALIEQLRARHVDTDALLDEIDAQLEAEPDTNSEETPIP